MTPEYYIVNYGFEEDPGIMEKILDSDIVFFTDVSFSPQYAMKLNTLVTQYGTKIFLFDHHESAKKQLEPLNYDWIHYDVTKSGTLLIYEFCMDMCNKIGRPEVMKDWRYFAEVVDGYDLWLHTDYNSTRMQFLWANTEHEQFVQRFCNIPFNGIFSDDEEETIVTSELILDHSVDEAEQGLKIDTDIEGYTFGVTNKPPFFSLVATQLFKAHPEMDYLVMSDGRALSFRSPNDGICVRPIAEALGGGGHDHASGAPMKSPMTDPLLTVKYRRWTTYDFTKKFSGFTPLV